MKPLPFYILSFTVFVLLVLPEALQEGMFVDGLTYIAVSKNLANGLGSFWFPHYSKTVYPVFHEHPPFVFGILAFYFKTFGSGYLTESLFSVLTGIVTAFLIIGIWRQEFKDSVYKQIAWLPVLCWAIIPLVSWTYRHNMLENTMGIFILLSFYCIHKSFSFKNYPVFPLVLAALFLLAAFLCKGLVALFLLAAPFLYWIVKKEYPFRKMITSTFILLLAFLVFLALLILFFPDAYTSLMRYFDVQVLQSISGKREIVASGSRFYILLRLFNELLPLLVFALAILAFSYFKKTQYLILKNGCKTEALFFILIGLSASLPLMVSPKQMGYYLVPAFPFFAIGISIFILPAVFSFIKWLNYQSKAYKFFNILVSVLFFGSLFFSFAQTGKLVRDKELIEDILLIGNIVPEGEIIATQEDMCFEWGLIAYFTYYFYISLDCSKEALHHYKLIKKENKNFDKSTYETVPLKLNNYELLKRRE